MGVLIDGNVITWTGTDVTPVILKCGVKKIGVNNNARIHLDGEKDTGNSSQIIYSLVNGMNELPNVYGYPNRLTPLEHDTQISAIITPSPHINPNYALDCTKILTGGITNE